MGNLTTSVRPLNLKLLVRACRPSPKAASTGLTESYVATRDPLTLLRRKLCSI